MSEMGEDGSLKVEVVDESDPRAYMWSKYKRYPYLLAKFVFWGGILYLIGYFLSYIESVLFPILVSFVTAYLLDPLVTWFEKKGVGRIWAIIIIILALCGTLTLFTLVLYPTFSSSIMTITQKIPRLGHTLFHDVFPWLEQKFGFKLPASVSETLTEYRAQIEHQIPVVIQRVSSAATDLFTRSQAILTSLINIVMIPIFSFYFLRDFHAIREKVLSFVPEHNNDKIMKRLERMDVVVGAWFRGQLTVAAILALLYSVGLGTVFGFSGLGLVPGIGIGILTGFLNIIPYFGVTTGFIISILMVLLDWSGVGPLIGVAIVFLVVQVLEGYVITPKIVGDAVGLSPVSVIIVLLLGGAAYGLIGILIATPVAGVIKVLLPDIIEYYKSSSFYTGKYVAEPLFYSSGQQQEHVRTRMIDESTTIEFGREDVTVERERHVTEEVFSDSSVEQQLDAGFVADYPVTNNEKGEDEEKNSEDVDASEEESSSEKEENTMA